MISVLDVLTIFVSGFIAAKVCDYADTKVSYEKQIQEA